MDDEIYISVPLDEYLELKELRDFLEILVDYDLEDWENFSDALTEFLEEDDSREDPLEKL